jgi:hypothetical protein
MNMSTVILSGKSVADIGQVVELALKKNIAVLPLSQKELEDIEDLKLLHIMREARNEGLADRKQTLEKLGL